jgi:hypothetical protein
LLPPPPVVSPREVPVLLVEAEEENAAPAPVVAEAELEDVEPPPTPLLTEADDEDPPPTPLLTEEDDEEDPPPTPLLTEADDEDGPPPTPLLAEALLPALGIHAPSWQEPPGHGVPSSTGAETHWPIDGEQVAEWQGSGAMHARGVPAQRPLVQVSPVVQATPSSQAAPVSRAQTPSAKAPCATVHAPQEPPLQGELQQTPSAQARPGQSASTAQGCPSNDGPRIASSMLTAAATASLVSRPKPTTRRPSGSSVAVLS